jgi:uncharacterized OB-fold protein
MEPLSAAISIEYSLSTGVAAGRCLSEFAHKRIVGARCGDCGRVLVPAEEYCPRCGGVADELLEMPTTGSVEAVTARGSEVLALVRLDGADTALFHRILDASLDELAVGRRVEVVWAEEPQASIHAIAGFRPSANGGSIGVPRAFTSDEETIAVVDHRIDLNYSHAYGSYYGRLFDELKTSQRILGVRCPSCHSVLVPPRPVCEVCYVPTNQFEDVADTGVLRAFSVIHLAFAGQVREPPYIYAEITLDGAATRLVHVLGGIDIESASATLRPGMRVRAVWKEGSSDGTLRDIDYFEPVSFG